MEQIPQFTPRRALGRTGFVATALGIGDVADRSLSLEACVATVRRAIDAGLNLIDTAPGYEDGYSEQIGGRAVKGVREQLFVVDKIDALDAPVGPQIDASLRRLQLDHADAFVFHGLSSMPVFEQLSQPGGGFDQLAACIKAGKARFGGISSHHPDVLRAAISAGLCDIVMFPIGPFVDPRYVDDILPLAKAHGVGTICFKTFGAGKLLGDTAGYNQPLQLRPRGKLSSGGASDTRATLPRLSVEECLHYTLTLDPDVALLGLSYPNEQDQAFVAARSFAPLAAAQMADIRRRAIGARQGKGPCWWNPDPEA
jgi:aryl-alcohol dehydrogenase-like predicted oxidoreductase